jgi:gliding motility-associated lipoprotein GldD
MMQQKTVRFLFVLLLMAGMASCNQHYTPKPRGYFRIDMPPKKYQIFDSTFPYSFEYPVYAKITGDPYAPEEKYWINIQYPKYRASIHISYKKVEHNLVKYLEDSRTLVVKHIAKADAIHDSLLISPDRALYGMTYDIEGNAVASPYQFILTDSSMHFLRGALYFNVSPNNDSLQPVIQSIKGDIRHLLSTFQWKN